LRADHALGSYCERDAAADERDLAAERRDRAADARDRAADRRDRSDRRLSPRDSAQAADDRRRAARDRRRASHDRRRARNDRRQANNDRQQAGLDSLTGALRRDRGAVDLQREIDRARRSDGLLIVAFVDIDGLKVINDTHGHAAGDRALRAVATALLDGLRSYDLVVRYGGDEFLCGLPGSDLDAAQRRFDAVARTLAEQDSGTSVSIGLAELGSRDSLEALTARADASLYATRRDARGHADADRAPRFTRSPRYPRPASPGALGSIRPRG
jgi:diguanylate cyclase (GGDEF)-like protein